MVFIAPPADSTPQPWPACFKPCGVPRRYRGQMLRESQPRSEIINFLNQKSHINGFSPLLAKVSSRIDPMVRTKHFTAYMRIPSHCYTKSRIHTCEPSFPAHLKLDLVRTAGFTLLPGQIHVVPTAAWDLNCLPSACSLADFSNSLVRLLVFPSCLPQSSNFGNDSLSGLCSQKSFK